MASNNTLLLQVCKQKKLLRLRLLKGHGLFAQHMSPAFHAPYSLSGVCIIWRCYINGVYIGVFEHCVERCVAVLNAVSVGKPASAFL